jgi:dTMP kinase
MKLLRSITDIAIDGTMPDITFFFDLDPEIGLKRRSAATECDRIENEVMEFHKRVHAGYQALAASQPGRIKTIDASKTEQEVWQEIRRHLDSSLGFVKLV